MKRWGKRGGRGKVDRIGGGRCTFCHDFTLLFSLSLFIGSNLITHKPKKILIPRFFSWLISHLSSLNPHLNPHLNPQPNPPTLNFLSSSSPLSPPSSIPKTGTLPHNPPPLSFPPQSDSSTPPPPACHLSIYLFF